MSKRTPIQVYETNKDLSSAWPGEPLEVALGDLVALFQDEAQKVCYSDQEARFLAAEALSDFVNTYSRHVIVG